jgi:hypothetical protein
MTDLNALIAEAEQYGELGKVREAVRPCDDCPSLVCGEFGDYGETPSPAAQKDCATWQQWDRDRAALAEAYAVIVKQAKMLGLAVCEHVCGMGHDDVGGCSEPSDDKCPYLTDILADLARRAKGET